MNDFVASFESFLKEQNPDICLTCWGEGRMIAILPRTGLRYDVECPDCRGTGKVIMEVLNG